MPDSAVSESSSTVFHITHWKAGSQWVRSVFKFAAPDRFVPDQPTGGKLLGGPLEAGRIYSPVYAPLTRFRSEIPEAPNQRIFLVTRDPRDTLVSWYFSLMYSHGTGAATVKESRDELHSLGKEEGMALMIRKHLREVAWIQREWLEAGTPTFTYEQLWSRPQHTFKQLFDYCGLNVFCLKRWSIVARHGFGLRTFFRFGKEDVKSHLRKGSPGDWRNHFTDDLKKLFKAEYGPLLALAGYEKDDNW